MSKTITVATLVGSLRKGSFNRQLAHALETLGFKGVQDVRAGKVIEIELAETDPARARAEAEEMARKLLANMVIESFKVAIETPGAAA